MIARALLTKEENIEASVLTGVNIMITLQFVLTRNKGAWNYYAGKKVNPTKLKPNLHTQI